MKFYLFVFVLFSSCNLKNSPKFNENNQLEFNLNNGLLIVSSDSVLINNKKQPDFAILVKLDLLNKIQLLMNDKQAVKKDSVLIGYSNIKSKNIMFNYLPINLHYDTTIFNKDTFRFFYLDKFPKNMFWGEPFEISICFNSSKKEIYGYYISFNSIWDGLVPIIQKKGHFTLPRKSLILNEQTNFCIVH